MRLMILFLLIASVSFPIRAQQTAIPPDVYDDPESLTQMAAIAAKHGLTDKMMEYLELASRAKQRAQISFLQSLMRGDVEGAMISAKRAGFTALAKRPEKIDPSSPNDHRWRIQYEGSPEIVLDVKESFELMRDFQARQNIYMGPATPR